MTFDVAGEAYGRFMGRFSEPLADQFVEVAGVTAGQRALDVGCGPGALAARLVRRLGADRVAAVDPSERFVEAARKRLPGADVRRGTAEELLFDDDAFDVAASQLVVHFMRDPLAGVREMRRVCRRGGSVALAVWKRDGPGVGPLVPFWRGVVAAGLPTRGEADLLGTGEGQLAELCEQAGLQAPETAVLTVAASFESFEDWWEPFTFGIGPAGELVAALDEETRERVRAACLAELGPGPFEVTGEAWAVRATA
jgi:SAM-dependent methyltransferase